MSPQPQLVDIVSLYRQSQDLMRARIRLDLQCQGLCRRYLDGDKEAAQIAWKAILKDEGDPSLTILLTPYLVALKALQDHEDGAIKEMTKIVNKHPLWLAWGRGVSGIGPKSMGVLLGEAGRPVSDYRTHGCVYKRFGVAVIAGQRQRKHRDAELAVVHGYDPNRRGQLYVIAESVFRKQDARYVAIYYKRKEEEQAKHPDEPLIVHHKRAMRYMSKVLLKDMWHVACRLEREDEAA